MLHSGEPKRKRPKSNELMRFEMELQMLKYSNWSASWMMNCFEFRFAYLIRPRVRHCTVFARISSNVQSLLSNEINSLSESDYVELENVNHATTTTTKTTMTSPPKTYCNLHQMEIPFRKPSRCCVLPRSNLINDSFSRRLNCIILNTEKLNNPLIANWKVEIIELKWFVCSEL